MKTQVLESAQSGSVWISGALSLLAAAGMLPQASHSADAIAAPLKELPSQRHPIRGSLSGANLEVAGGRKTLVPPKERKPLELEIISDAVLAIHAALDSRQGESA